jgi:hypothetical protein
VTNPTFHKDEALRADPRATAAINAIDSYQWCHGLLEQAARNLANHVATRSSCERAAYDALNVPKGDGKLPTQTWLKDNYDLSPVFSDWRKIRNELEADYLNCQGDTATAKLKADLAVRLVGQ